MITRQATLDTAVRAPDPSRPVVGFTGTRRGMSPLQRVWLRAVLLGMRPAIVHHGDCVGSDAEFHAICRELFGDKVWIVVHPPEDDSLRAFMAGDEILAPRPYIERDDDIIAASMVIIATPGEATEVLRSGTWTTIRHARKAGKKVIILPL